MNDSRGMEKRSNLELENTAFERIIGASQNGLKHRVHRHAHVHGVDRRCQPNAA